MQRTDISTVVAHDPISVIMGWQSIVRLYALGSYCESVPIFATGVQLPSLSQKGLEW
jgi:hypothetical protein